MNAPPPFPPSTMTLDRYSRKRTADLQSSMAAAIGLLLRSSTFPGPRGKGSIALAKVFDEWPSANDVALSPAACVRTPEPIRYGALLTPTLFEETWEPKGALGVGLYKLTEGECDYRIELRAASKAERAALVAGIEDLFVEPMVLNNRAAGAQNGRVLPMPGYWGLPARFSHRETLTSDDAEGAKTGRWDAEFLIAGQASRVKLGVVSPFRVTIREVVT